MPLKSGFYPYSQGCISDGLSGVRCSGSNSTNGARVAAADGDMRARVAAADGDVHTATD
jgi:hypothetical protein